ncbi:hypothetical protein [Microbispora hainanensis]|uniref:Ig-like domain-containing protein n=1 Tax=Microbispora hainanensis TaxID=568844 RepID=A0A544YPN8_9ACTN|nr:hypothetical protein [Microbispora hainanensis]TQS18725.1 hypothetical protein FLX08_23535 [Microbispora hainanensis]
MREGATVAGHRLTGRTRRSEVGTWADAVSADGRPSGALRFDPPAVATAGARERLVAAVGADLRLQSDGPIGLLPVIDLVAARDEVWLITTRATPSVADLMAAGRLDLGGAATVLVETAQALLAVHAAGAAHGALHAGTIVIGEDGSALLAERGLLRALRGEHASAEQDVAAWAALAGALAADCGQGHAAAALRRASATAVAHGLAAARETLLGERGAFPGVGREGLAHAAQNLSAPASPVSPEYRGSPEYPASPEHPGYPAVAAAGSSGGEAVTLLDLPDATEGPGDVMMRFGPGVPTETTAAQIWRSGQTSAAVTATHAGRPAPRRRRRRSTAWAGTLLLAILIAAAILWLRQAPAASLAVSDVDVKAPSKTVRCGGTADFVGIVTTNGEAGTIRYRWLRSDGRKPVEGEQPVSSGNTSVDLPLHWNVKGSGTFKGTATLRILSPTASGKPIQDKASFTYKC